MGRTARVASIDVLETISVALKKFRDEGASAMDDLDVELHRALDWIHHDRKDFWNHERRKAEERVAEAKIQLKQAQASRRMADYKPSCVDEIRALERAKRRLQIAEEKIRAVQHWTGAIERAVNACQRSRTQFAVWLDTDLPKAVSSLNRMSDSLENYIAVEVATAPTAVIAAATDSSQEAIQPSQSTEAAGGLPQNADAAQEQKEQTP